MPVTEVNKKYKKNDKDDNDKFTADNKQAESTNKVTMKNNEEPTPNDSEL